MSNARNLAKVAVDANGDIGTASLDNLTGALGYTPVNKAGDTMTGQLTIDSGLIVNNNIIGNSRAILAYGADIKTGHLGFNRDITNGNIYDVTKGSAFQLSHYGSSLKSFGLEAYDGVGGSQGNAFEATIDTTSGRGIFLQPNQPRFVAHDDRGQGQQSVASLNISQYFTTTSHNNGNYYNTSNGRFTAPVSGYYVFGWNFFTTSTSADQLSRTGIIKNGNIVEWSGGDRVGHANQGSVGIYLNKSDYITLGTQGGTYTAYWYSGYFHSRFWGYLAG